MSTNVVITPVAAGVAAAAILPLVVAAGAVWAVSRVLAETDAEYAALLEKCRDERRRDRLATMQLRSADLERLVRSGREARFQTTALPNGSVRLRTSPQEALWAVPTPEGIRLVGHEQALRRIAVANTTSRAVEHLQARGYRVATTLHGPGDVRITATGRGREVVKVAVGSSGDATVDPQHFSGRECEGVVRDLAAAIDGTIVKSSPKPEYWHTTPVKVGGVTRG